MQVVVGFVEKMNDACDRDREANKAKQPGLNKLNMLPEVVAMLQKYANSNSFNTNLSFGGINNDFIQDPLAGAAHEI
jgi:hypothetical protein